MLELDLSSPRVKEQWGVLKPHSEGPLTKKGGKTGGEARFEAIMVAAG